jgi:DNA mismatch repair protein MutS2
MKTQLAAFCLKNNLSPFEQSKTSLKIDQDSIFKTRDAKSLHQKVLNKLSSSFHFKESSNIWQFFQFTDQWIDISKRQEFFQSLNSESNANFLSEISTPRKMWRPKYDVIAVTEDESTFVALNKIGVTAQLIVSENDIVDLQRYDIVQVVDCEDFKIILEKLPQSVFVDSIDEVYLERYLEELSGWQSNFEILVRNFNSFSREMQETLREIEPLFDLLDNKKLDIITEERVEKALEEINEKISVKIKDLMISGEGLLKMLGENKMPKEILEIVQKSIEESKISEHIFNVTVPVTIDYSELESQIKISSANEFTNLAEMVKRNASAIKNIPKNLENLSILLLVEDFCFGVSNFLRKTQVYPTTSENVHMNDSSNMFLNNAQPISFQLDSFSKCSILTGANSGGKTTLLEHLLQNISLFQLGLPISGEVHLPIFTEVYYFAKTKGSTSKGAFETLLSQMSKIKPGSKTLILADEIEAVTEPGVAGKIIAATAEFFISKDCYMVLATHLGAEIQKNLPKNARVDGIEAKGLDENFNLVVDHNPVLGRLAHSTPELIVERMAGATGGEYFEHLNSALKKDGEKD